MDRRQLLVAGAALAATAATSSAAPSRPALRRPGRFKLHYAPHLGMFQKHAGNHPVDQIKFMADEGFTAMEDNGMPRRDPKMQEQIAAAMSKHKMTMGVFVAHAHFGQPTFADGARHRDHIKKDMERAVEVAKRVNARWCTVVPGTFKSNVEWDYQAASVVDNLRFAADICAKGELTMVLEPLNHWANHPGVFLSKIPQAFLICRAVDSPYCKILDDLYHQQIQEGNLIPNIDKAWSEIAYFQVGDNPGRREPGTGEINYRNVFRHIHQKGFEGVVGMEHGNSMPGKKGERAVIDAYVAADAF
jgi:hydroxypyruvate isomerase